MHFSGLLAAACVAAGLVGAAPQDTYGAYSGYGGEGGYFPVSEQEGGLPATKALQYRGLLNLVSYVSKNGLFNQKCSLKNVGVRREWGELSKKERKEWIAAVKCLHNKPPKTPKSIAPGVRSRYDDFVYTHINQSFFIHATGNFPAWHRYYTWNFEQALRNECGYKGYQPYADWSKYVDDPASSPVFDGSDSSLGGDGEYEEHNIIGIPSNDLPQMTLPPQKGGGCVKKGPFKDFQAHMGPCFPALKGLKENPREDCLGYNPRCLRRDISSYVSKGWLKDSDSFDLISGYRDPASWNYRLNGDFANGYLGVHSAGHFTWGGDPGGDFMNSPADPAFWLHHAYIDRIWWIWQNLDVASRTFSVGGTITVLNNPPSRNASLDDTVNSGLNGKNITIRDAGSTIGAKPFCYIYV